MTTAKDKPTGTGVREIGRRWGTSGAYVVQFLQRAGLEPLPGGGYDYDEATKLRAKYTVIGKGKKRWERHHPGETPVCQGCGDRYIEKYSRNSQTPHPDRFCSASCEQDLVDGFTPAQIAQRREKAICPKNLKFVEHDRWTPPPKPTPIVRICVGCGGRYDQSAPEARDPERFCSENCQVEVEAGLTQAEIRRQIRTGCREGGSTLKEVNAPNFFDYGTA